MKETLDFIGQMARRWRTTGAIAPSGKFLARAMVQNVGELAPDQVILELGPGTGVFTRELLAKYPRNKIIAVEFNDVFVKLLRQNIPDVTVVQGCASKLDEHLRAEKVEPEKVGVILSGLPLLSLPGDLPPKVIASITSTLPAGRKYIQFTYSKKAWQKFEIPGFERLPSQRIWLNIPPAVVMPFRKL